MELSHEFLKMILVLVSVALGCVVIQHLFRKDLERDQYYYLRDISLVAAWALCGIWTQDIMVKLVITAGVIAALVGFCQKVLKRWELRFVYLLIGFCLSLVGPRTAFLGLSHGEFFYLSTVSSVVLSTFWIGFFPILFQELDEIPGMGGSLMLLSWVLLALITAISSKGHLEALSIEIFALVLFLAFWSRHMNIYRRLDTPLASLWGTLLAGTSMLGASKGVAFSTVMFLPLGLFALPIIETSVSVFSAAFLPKPLGSMLLYRRLVNNGFDHPAAVYFVVATCAYIGTLIAFAQIYRNIPIVLFLGCIGVVGAVMFLKMHTHPIPRNTRRPLLWGVPIDNVSLNYALARVSSWATHNEGFQMIVTPDALALLLSRQNTPYRKIVQSAGLVLPDGVGLIWALKFLGTPVQARLAGVEFMEHLCRQASSEDCPVYFLGGKKGVAVKASQKMRERYPGLRVVGAQHGYYSCEEEGRILDDIKVSGAKIIFVGFGVPNQEIWMSKHLPELGIVGMGIGGSMDVLSGGLKRAPRTWQRVGLEWFYRVLQEPWRFKRAIKLPVFVFFVLLTRLGIISNND